MSAKAYKNASSTAALQEMAAPARKPTAAMEDLGQAGNAASLARLENAIKELKAMAAAPLLQKAVAAMSRENFVAGGKWALKALEQDEFSGLGWYLLGMARERAGDYASSVQAYEAALKLLPEHADIANDLGRLANRMGMHQQAEKLFRHYAAHMPDSLEAVNNLASSIKDQGRYDEATQVLKEALGRRPDSALLWNTLATVMNEQASLDNALIFFSEAARLDPKYANPRYNLSQVKIVLGDAEGALADCEAAMKMKGGSADDKAMMKLARSNFLLANGRIGEGWDEYEIRLSSEFGDVTHFAVDRPRWKPGAKIAGKTLLVVGEQGLGDEVLFSNLLPDVMEALGPDGKLQLAVEARLVPLYQRTFPNAEVTRHRTVAWATRPLRTLPDFDQSRTDLWTPIGSMLREFRRSVDAYPPRVGFLTPDPERVAHWKKVLEEQAPPGPKVGILWKSLIGKDARHRFFSPFERWKGVLQTPGVSFVNLQYGDCEAELAQAKAELGVTIWQPPEIDLKMDLDDVTALCAAMDLVIGFSNATVNLAGAGGAPVWIITPAAAWTRLNAESGYPWYPQARTFLNHDIQNWDPVMEEVTDALHAFAKERA
jgi:tetratricopeptide (TPR) repeat protein